MLDFEIQRFTRRCARTDRELQPGDVYYSVLMSDGADVVRCDYSEAAWEGPPDDAIGVWRSRIPAPDQAKTNWAPNDVMLDYFERLAEDPARSDTRFVLALLLLRRRVVRLEDTEESAGGSVMVLHCPRNEKEYRVVTADPRPERVQEIQTELAQLLFADPEGGS